MERSVYGNVQMFFLYVWVMDRIVELCHLCLLNNDVCSNFGKHISEPHFFKTGAKRYLLFKTTQNNKPIELLLVSILIVKKKKKEKKRKKQK